MAVEDRERGWLESVAPRLKKASSRFFFEWFIELYHNDIVKGLKNYLKTIKPEDVPTMVKETRFPSMEKVDFGAVSDFAEHCEKITVLRLMEAIAEARPDLATAIQDMGMPGAEYMVKLRTHLLDLVKHPEKAISKSTKYKPKEEMVLATCDKCQNSWPVPKSQAASIDKCPFCEQ